MCEISAKNIWTALNRLGGIIGFEAAATIRRQAILYLVLARKYNSWLV